MPSSDNPLAPLFQAWLDVAMPHRQGPVLGKVEKAQSDAQGYVCSVSLLDAGTLEETGEQLEGVAINALWAGANGAGIFALPAVGQLVVVGFIGMNRAFPFVAGAWGGGKGGPSGLQDGELLLTQGNGNGNGASIKLDVQGMLAFANQSESLGGILLSLIDDLSSLKTIPAALGTSLKLLPDDIIKIQAYKGRVAALLAP